MKKIYLFLIIAMSMSFSPRETRPIRKNLLFDFTAENADCLTVFGKNMMQNYNSIGRCCSYSATRSVSQARSGNFSILYNLRKTDPDIYLSKRVEAARASNDEPALIPRWYGLSFYLPTDYIKDPSPESVSQWQSPKGMNPPLAIWTDNGKWKIVVFGVTKYDLGNYVTGKWTDYVLHVKWSTGPWGLIEVWKDGVKVKTIPGANSYEGYPEIT